MTPAKEKSASPWARRWSAFLWGVAARGPSAPSPDIEESQEEIEDLEEEIAELETELAAAAQEITRQWADLLDDLATEELHPRRTDVDVRLLALAWLPTWLVTYDDGGRTQTAAVPAYRAGG
jgi:hypothetical protein